MIKIRNVIKHLIISISFFPIIFVIMGLFLGICYANSIKEVFMMGLEAPIVIYSGTINGNMWNSGDGFGRLIIFIAIGAHLIWFFIALLKGFPSITDMMEPDYD